MTALRRRVPLDEAVHIEVVYFYAGTRALIDVDNMLKPILDALQRLIYTNDSRVINAEIRVIGRYQPSAPVRLRSVTQALVAALGSSGPFVFLTISAPSGAIP
jgi:Holliday junction resolvase RusA-like endonuclease